MKIDNVNFQKSVILWANSGGGCGESMFSNVDVDGGSNQGTSNIAALILVRTIKNMT